MKEDEKENFNKKPITQNKDEVKDEGKTKKEFKPQYTIKDLIVSSLIGCLI